MSYGTPDGVADRARVWSLDGHWLDANEPYDIRATNPSLTTVNDWLDQISATMDLALQASWFNLPVDEVASPSAYKSIVNYVESLVADMARRANGEDVEIPPIGKIMKDMSAWVTANEDGFLADGMTQTPTPSQKSQTRFTVLGNL